MGGGAQLDRNESQKEENRDTYQRWQRSLVGGEGGAFQLELTPDDLMTHFSISPWPLLHLAPASRIT